MSPAAAQLLEAAKKLSVNDRDELADAIWRTIDEELPVTLSPEWKAEIKRRIEESDRGEVVYLTDEEVDARLKARFPFLRD
jgi:putative addiction module component (TIGR02574 family)